LAKNPSVQEKLREEIKNATRDDSDEDSSRISYDELMELPYLDQVIYESLRMNPPLTFSNRECSDPIQLDGVKGHKIEIEKGLRVFIPILSIHHDSGWFVN
jgi:cytochrome P450